MFVEALLVLANHAIGQSEDENFHVTVRAFHRDWEKMVAGEYLKQKAPSLVRMGGYLGVQSTYSARGLSIDRVLRGSPASKAGLRAGDIVTHIDGEKIESGHAFSSTIAGKSPKDKLNFSIRRRGAEKKIQVTLGRRPDSKQ